MSETKIPKPIFPAQHQDSQPGIESLMNPLPIFDNQNYRPSGKLQGKVAIVSGGDSGIGRAVAILFAKEGADIVIPYFNEHDDAHRLFRIQRGSSILYSFISRISF